MNVSPPIQSVLAAVKSPWAFPATSPGTARPSMEYAELTGVSHHNRYEAEPGMDATQTPVHLLVGLLDVRPGHLLVGA